MVFPFVLMINNYMIKEKTLQQKREYQRQAQAAYRRRCGKLTHEQHTLLNSEMFVSRSKHIHKNVYDYSHVTYKSATQKVTIVCPKHGNFQQRPDAHLRGQGCPVCGAAQRHISKRKTTAMFIKQANSIHKNMYGYTLSQYTTINTKLIIGCPDHGDFVQTPKAHLRGQGCPLCANERRMMFFQSIGEKTIQEFLEKRNIYFETQKMFQFCKYKGHLRFDFFVPSHNLLIEFDGEQHYVFIKRFHKTKEVFETFQQRDEIKNAFAKQNNIRLVRIRFDQQKDIPTILSLLF